MLTPMPARANARSRRTPLAATILDRVVTIYQEAADPTRAAPMRAYMRDQFPFLGIPGPMQKTLTRQVLSGLAPPDEADLRAVAFGCWSLPEREYQYFACAWLRRHAKLCSADFLDTARYLIVTKSWWDTVDALASHLVGPLVAHHPTLDSTMDEWAAEENLWLARTALLHQLTFKQTTDEERLFRYCGALATQQDFFIRKGIGWALREYSRVAPDAVRRFVQTNADQLSGLSTREALRNI